MDTEYEAKFLNIDKDRVRGQLRNTGAVLLRPEFLQKRIPFCLPKGSHSKDSWIRVRDEVDKVTLSFKAVVGEGISDQKEISVEVSNFDETVKILEAIGCKAKSYQETKRELWRLHDVDITIDEWPFLEPFVEVEGKSEAAVREVSIKIGFDYGQAIFGAVNKLYHMKYGIDPSKINTAEKIVFDMKNPFVKEEK